MKHFKQVIELRRTTTEFATVTVWVPESATSREAADLAAGLADRLNAWHGWKVNLDKISVHTIEETETGA